MTTVHDGAVDGLMGTGIWSARAVERRMSDLLPGDGRTGTDTFLADASAVQAAAAAGSDHVLYYAVRDVLSPRIVPADDGSGGLTWSADLVTYRKGALPGGEPFRSIGHWNPAGQLEIFQVLSGRVLMVTSGTSTSGRPFTQYQECRTGDLAVVPFGAWHLTYVLDGPAVVFNIYSSPHSAHTPHSGAESEPAGMAKYRCGRDPAQIAVVREMSGLRFVLGPEESRSGEPTAVCCPAWLRMFVPEGASLPGWCLRVPDAGLRELAASAQVAARSGWPA